jgi:hypothetical protein
VFRLIPAVTEVLLGQTGCTIRTDANPFTDDAELPKLFFGHEFEVEPSAAPRFANS